MIVRCVHTHVSDVTLWQSYTHTKLDSCCDVEYVEQYHV